MQEAGCGVPVRGVGWGNPQPAKVQALRFESDGSANPRLKSVSSVILLLFEPPGGLRFHPIEMGINLERKGVGLISDRYS